VDKTFSLEKFSTKRFLHKLTSNLIPG